MVIIWKFLALASVLWSTAYSHAIPHSDIRPRDLEDDNLAKQPFGSLRWEQLEKLYGEEDDAEDDFDDKNEKLLELKKKVKADDKSYTTLREAYYQGDGAELAEKLKKVPKGNYAHLHFNAYLKKDAIMEVYKKVQEELGDKFTDEDNKLFLDTMNGANEHGDLMEFPTGELPGRADKAWPTFQGLTPKFKVPFEYEAFWRHYLQAIFRDWVDHGILHGELRHVFLQETMTTKDGEQLKQLKGEEAFKQMLNIIREEVEKARKEYGGKFVGAKLIYCIPRIFVPKEEDEPENRPHWSAEWHVKNYIELAKWEKDEHKGKEVLVAFDIVGREDQDNMRSTAEYKDQLDDLLNQASENDLPANLALHAGEALGVTKDTKPGQNMQVLAELADKYKDKSKMRGAHLVGFEYAETNGDVEDWMEKFDKNNVGAELCPVSNEVLGTSLSAEDHANRYGIYIMEHLSTSVSGDDPTYFGLEPTLEYFYVLLGSDKMDLKRLIALTHMSINTSYMTEDELEEAFKITAEQIKELDF